MVETGGKQHRVVPGDSLNVELLAVEEGSTVELERVLLVGEGDKILVGSPTIDGAKVFAKVNNHGRGKKILVYRYKSKARYSNKLGHRQHFTNITIERIDVPELKSKTTRKNSDTNTEENQDGA
ncbi:MAG: 50S ribosomal protein L21 [Dehalococcoidales bacterium]